jgi:hypothetical protein
MDFECLCDFNGRAILNVSEEETQTSVIDIAMGQLELLNRVPAFENELT